MSAPSARFSFLGLCAALLFCLAAPGCERASAEAQETTLMQVGPGGPAGYNPEEHFINLIDASSAGMWETPSGLRGLELIEQGVIDERTGMPQRWPGEPLHLPGFMNGRPGEAWDGEWVIEWECEGGGSDCALMGLVNAKRANLVKYKKGRIEFTRKDHPNTNNAVQIAIGRLDRPLTRLAIFRKENEEAYRAGKIYNPRFLDAMKHYDIIRTMDMQRVNLSIVTKVEDLPAEGSSFWGNGSWLAGKGQAQKTESMPLSAVVALGVESGKSLWICAPLTLGSPKRSWELKPEEGGQEREKWANAYSAMAKENAEAIVASKAWDDYADALVAALDDSAYPADRMLYVTIGNEVWNGSPYYLLNTQYAVGVGQGLSAVADLKQRPDRAGYGVLFSRMKLALDAAFKRAGRDQAVTYVMEGQAGWWTSAKSLEAARKWLESEGETWSDHAPQIGLSVASYWNAKWEEFLPKDKWAEEIKRDPEGLAGKFADFILTSNTEGGSNYIFRNYRSLVEKTKSYGVRPIGFYEGGSHLIRPDFVDKDWYADFLWGPEGGRVNYEVNMRLAKAFPGIILSNFTLAGEVGGLPFSEGPLGAENPYAESWERIYEETRGIAP